MNKKISIAMVAVFALSGCATTEQEAQHDHDKVAALRVANHADREVDRHQQAVKVAEATLVTANVALEASRQEQQKAHTNFESLYKEPQPLTGQ